MSKRAKPAFIASLFLLAVLAPLAFAVPTSYSVNIVETGPLTVGDTITVECVWTWTDYNNAEDDVFCDLFDGNGFLTDGFDYNFAPGNEEFDYVTDVPGEWTAVLTFYDNGNFFDSVTDIIQVNGAPSSGPDTWSADWTSHPSFSNIPFEATVEGECAWDWPDFNDATDDIVCGIFPGTIPATTTPEAGGFYTSTTSTGTVVNYNTDHAGYWLLRFEAYEDGELVAAAQDELLADSVFDIQDNGPTLSLGNTLSSTCTTHARMDYAEIWSECQILRPDLSIATFQNVTGIDSTSSPSFSTDVEGTWRVRLVVTFDHVDSPGTATVLMNETTINVGAASPNGVPSVSFILPDDGFTYNLPAQAPLRAVASDPEGSPLTVNFFLDCLNCQFLGQGIFSPSGYWQYIWGDPGPVGTHDLIAVASDGQDSGVDVITIHIQDASGGGGGGSVVPSQPPLNPLAYSSGNSHLGVSWSPPADTGSAPLDEDAAYHVRLYPSWASPEQSSFFIDTWTLDHFAARTGTTGLTPGSEYCYAIWAFNSDQSWDFVSLDGDDASIACGTVDGAANGDSDPIVTITSPPMDTLHPDSSPVTITADAFDDTGPVYDVTFTAQNSLTGAIYQATDGAAPFSASLSLPQGSYSLYARARDTFGQVGYSIHNGQENYDIEVTGSAPGVPGIPQNVTLDIQPSNITISWDPPLFDGNSNITHYNVYHATSSGGPYTLLAAPTATTYLHQTGLGSGFHCYRITATNGIGQGPYESNCRDASTITATETGSGSLGAGGPVFPGIDFQLLDGVGGLSGSQWAAIIALTLTASLGVWAHARLGSRASVPGMVFGAILCVFLGLWGVWVPITVFLVLATGALVIGQVRAGR